MKILKKIYNKIFINYKYISSLFDKQNELNNEKMDKTNDLIKQINEKINTTNNELANINLKLDKIISFNDFINFELNSLNLIPNTQKIKILLVGFYGAYNIGDDLMLNALLKQLDHEKYDITIMFSRNSNIKINDFHHTNCIYYPKKGNDFYIIASKFDKVIFGGGAIIDDSKFEIDSSFQYDLGTIFLYLSNEFILQNKEVYAIGVSCIKNLTNEKYITFLRKVVDNAKYFSVRDENSLYYLSHKLDTKKIRFIPDLVFSLNYNNVAPQKTNKELKSIGIIWICTNETKDSLIKLIEILKDYEIHLIPFYDYLNNDLRFFKSIKFTKNVIIENFTNNIDELYVEYSKCDFIISMRYHGILLGYMFNKITLALNFDMHKHYYNKISYITKLFSEEYVNFSDLFDFNIKNYFDKKHSDKKNIVLKQKDVILKQKEKFFKEIKELKNFLVK